MNNLSYFVSLKKEKDKWDNDHFLDVENDVINPKIGKPYEEYDNPYVGIPNMLRFAFDLRKFLNISLESLFETNNDKDNIRFIHEDAVLDLLKILDGSKQDKNIISFLNIPKIKNNNVCKHIVMVLPKSSSCDAIARLLKDHSKEFINLKKHKVINVDGNKALKALSDINIVKEKISNAEKNGKKTLLLTVDSMLKEDVIEELDTMIMFKDTRNKEEYEQIVTKLLNQYVITYNSYNDYSFKKDMKPQTILVDFDPFRVLNIQDLDSKIVDGVLNIDENNLKEAIQAELRYFPIIGDDGNCIVKITLGNIIKAISNYIKKD